MRIRPHRAHAPSMHAPSSHTNAFHSHTSTSDSERGRLALVLALSAAVMVAELIGSALAGSLALLTDAGHMLVDCAGLGIALAASHILRQPRSNRHTWGFARVEVLSAALQAGMLLAVCTIVSIEAIRRMMAPTFVHATSMAAFAAVGLAANILGIFLLHGHSSHSLNTRAALLEVFNDALGSLAVLAAAGVTAISGWAYADPLASLIVAALMLPRAWIMLRTCIRILMESTPEGIDIDQVRTHMLSNEHVIDVHDLHVASISSHTTVLTAHVTIDPQCFYDGSAVPLLHSLQECVSEHFPLKVDHCTIQLDVPQHRDHEQLHH